MSFGERLAASVAERESQLFVGVDPDPHALWPAAEVAGSAHAGSTAAAVDARDEPAARTAAAVAAHCRALIDAVAPACVGVKLQLACFERLGAPGWATMGAVARHARELGLLVIADGKRGDIATTAVAYGQVLFGGAQGPWGRLPGLDADMATANPLLGADALAPLVAAARERGAGVLALVRTSNPGAADVQELALADGGLVWERLAGIVRSLGEPSAGERPAVPGGAAGGLADVGAVLGATAPRLLARARELMPHAPFLLPGIGAQGGRVEELAAALAPLEGPARRASVLVTAARSIANAHRQDRGEPADAARAEAERLRAAAWALT
jgi:orotidine-5'-phosphate decarboxylase